MEHMGHIYIYRFICIDLYNNPGSPVTNQTSRGKSGKKNRWSLGSPNSRNPGYRGRESVHNLLVYMGWKITQLCGDYFMHHEMRVRIKQPIYSICWYTEGWLRTSLLWGGAILECRGRSTKTKRRQFYDEKMYTLTTLYPSPHRLISSNIKISDQNPGCLLSIGDENLPSYRWDLNKSS